MDFGLQMGHGMQSLAIEFLKNQGTLNPLILSPRNFSASNGKSGFKRMAEFANGPIRKLSGNVLVDPQLFTGGNATLSLRQFPHWQVCSGSLWNNPEAVLAEVALLNQACATDMFIIPSDTIDELNINHLDRMGNFAAKARKVASSRKTIMTLSFGEDVLREANVGDQLLGVIEDWDVDGFYVVSEHPRKEYLVDQPLWLYNYMTLIAGIKRMGKIAYAGYGSHQLLPLVLCGCDCLFSGNYLNVRRFDKGTFKEKEAGMARRACWYYAPQALSEFKVTTLDLAFSSGALDALRSPFNDEEYVGMLFRGTLPSNTAYNERRSFMHYLICLNQQCRYLTASTYSKVHAKLKGCFDTAQSLIDGLQPMGISDRDRNYANALPAAAQAVAAFDSGWGFSMKREWSSFFT